MDYDRITLIKKRKNLYRIRVTRIMWQVCHPYTSFVYVSACLSFTTLFATSFPFVDKRVPIVKIDLSTTPESLFVETI